MLIPYGGIYAAVGATAQALSTTPEPLECFDLATGYDADSSHANDGDPAIIPDKAESRIKVNPGKYLVWFDAAGTTDGAAVLTFQLYKGTTAIAGALSENTWSTSVDNHSSFSAIIDISANDADGTLATLGTPSGTFTGGAGSPKTLVALSIYVTASTGTPSITVQYAHLNMIRVG